MRSLIFMVGGVLLGDVIGRAVTGNRLSPLTTYTQGNRLVPLGLAALGAYGGYKLNGALPPYLFGGPEIPKTGGVITTPYLAPLPNTTVAGW